MQNDAFTRIESLKERNDLYQRMIEEIQDYAIILMDTNGIIRNWNRGAEKIKGYSEDEIIGKHFSIFYLPEDQAVNLPQRLLSIAERTGRASQEGWRKRKDGSKFWGSITITALHDEEDRVIGYCKVTRDLTDKKAAEDRLRMSEERYHQMVAEVQDYAIILLDADGIIQNWNVGAEKIKGYVTEEIIGKRFDVFYPEKDKNAALPDRLLNEARTSGKATHEGWRVRKDGTKFWGSIVITALHNKEGEIIGFSKVTRDLTEKKLSEDRLAAYTAELEIQNRELEQFAYVASHDLQEPLRKIQTFSELIRENFDDKEFVERYFEKVDASARRMGDLIRSLLNYSRLTKEKDNSQMPHVSLSSVLKDIEQDFELLIQEKSAVIIADELPVISGDKMQLTQLFSNLIGNSLKFSKEDPRITIKTVRVPGSTIPEAAVSIHDRAFHLISVEDNGIGFEQQYSKSIFSLFQRLHGKQEYAGTGIGLALCKKIVENHNGFIEATSEPGAGAKFFVYLPETKLG